MEQNNIYYTPSIEDLYVGYECQLKIKNNERYIPEFYSHRFGYDIVKDAIIYQDGFFNNQSWEIRTKYLDKEDIESLGWKLNNEDNINMGYTYSIGMISLYYYKSKGQNKIHIMKYDPIFMMPQVLYYGECKSINELKKIMKWLKIN